MLPTCSRRLGQKEYVGVLVLVVIGLLLLLQQINGGFWEQSDSPLELSAETQIYDVDSGGYIVIRPRYMLAFSARVKMLFSDSGLVTTMDTFLIPAYSIRDIYIPLHTEEAVGHVTMTFKSDSPELPKLYRAHVHIKIVHYVWLAYLSFLIGWSYFLAWSVSYYPQFCQNWKRRSVVGLSFDYVLLNIIGHSCYCAFNASLYYNSYIQRAYMELNPNSEIPVQANDLFFSVHAVLMTSLIIVQCQMYERGDQHLSSYFICISAGMVFTIVGGLLLAFAEQITWLRYVYLLSFVKVAVTPLKYLPQVWLNHSRQSMEGFAISGVILDFVGGLLSMSQAVVDSANSSDWSILLGNPGKLALAFIGIGFNVIFFLQYALFAGPPALTGRTRKIHDKMATPASSVGTDDREKAGIHRYWPGPLMLREI